jgi:hypothetical protein
MPNTERHSRHRGPGGRAGLASVLAATVAASVGASATVAASGCGGGGSSPSPMPLPDPAALCAAGSRDPGPSPMRRLTRTEYGRTLRDLLAAAPGGAALVDVSGLPPDERAAGFDDNADVMGTSDLLIEQYADVAARAAAVVTGDLARFLPCAAAGAGDAACADTFIKSFGGRAWRRPLTTDETASLRAVLAEAETQGDTFAEGIGRVVEVVLQSPQFMYRVEAAAGSGAAPELPGAVRLSPHETAVRLSYLIWGTMPDDALMAAAAEDRLATSADVVREARRMLDDPRAREPVQTFHAQWLGLDNLDDLDKDRVVYPAFEPALADSFRAETVRFVDEVVWSREGTLRALLTAPYTFVDRRLAAFYGVDAPGASDTQMAHVALDPTRRAGLLTHASLLSIHAKANQTSPVHRGRFVREQLFCTVPPPPPADLEIRPPDLDPRLTTRQRFAQHTADQYCSSCHMMLDPIGFGFEHFDGLGRWRDRESGNPIDTTGELHATDVDGKFDGVVELGQRLAGSARVSRCYATQWFRFGYGRGESAADTCSVDTLAAALSGSKGNVRQLILALVVTDAFRYRRPPEVGP